MTNHQVPWLRSGKGSSPAEGGCIMQIVDWLDNTSWSDRPECVHPVIREVAIRVNDALKDNERQKLLDLTSRLMGTNTGGEKLTRQLLGYLARQVYPRFEHWAHETGYDDHGSVLACVEAAERGVVATTMETARAAKVVVDAENVGTAGAARAARAAGVAWDAVGPTRAVRIAEAARIAWASWAVGIPSSSETSILYDMLVGLLDHYDELTGRTKIEPVDVSPVCEILGREYVH